MTKNVLIISVIALLLIAVFAAIAMMSAGNAVSGSREHTGIIAEEKEMMIKVSDGTSTVIFRLNDSPSSKSLYGMLPIDAEVRNYSNNEKIFTPPQEIDTTGGIEGDCHAGTFALFSPWGNAVMYYGDAPAYPGLYLLGEAVEGGDRIKDISGTIHVEAV
ncbi:cyclophilin-like fold protein [Methanomicrobium mobile]|uniref:cyclophilin-like fold protein n=1 Tax=Methanomicrobium mobile TaxID=2205 RepID=UPI0005B2B139|nr:cyclophilin-like fold protein [Methanomicrobium mobile]